MQFRYIGKEHSVFMGHEWITGLVHDVTDEHAIAKLSNSVLFEKVDGGGKPAKATVEAKGAGPGPGSGGNEPESEVLADEPARTPRKKRTE